MHYPGYTQMYAHLDSIATGLVVGANIAQEQQIGVVGTTGNASGNPVSTAHLHFGVQTFGQDLSPSFFLNTPCPWSLP